MHVVNKDNLEPFTKSQWGKGCSKLNRNKAWTTHCDGKGFQNYRLDKRSSARNRGQADGEL